MKPPRVMTPMGVLHLPEERIVKGEGRCTFYAPGELEKWAALVRGVRALPGQPLDPAGVPALQGLIHAVPPPPRPDTSGRVLTMAAVALLLGLPSGREARKFLRRNGLKPVPVGRKHFIQKATVEDFIIRQEKEPTPAAVYAKARGGAGRRGAAVDRAVEKLDAERKSHAPA